MIVMAQQFKFEECNIQGLFKISPFMAADLRGEFIKDYSTEIFERNGIILNIKETLYTKSAMGVVRGLHFQREKQMSKLVRCVKGHIYDFVVDLRKDSPTFKSYAGFDLIEENGEEIFIPEGFAHGFIAIEESIVCYKCGESFYSEYDDGIIWDDETININWPVDRFGGKQNIILSDKDKNLQTFDEFMFNYGGF